MTGIWLVSYIALWILFLVVAILLLSVLHNLGAIYDLLPEREPAPTKLEADDILPEIELVTLSSGQKTLISDFEGVKTAFSIVSSGCSSCVDFLEGINNGSDPDPLDPTVRQRVLIGLGDDEWITRMIREVNLPPDLPILLDRDRGVVETWGISATPATVIVDNNLRVVRQLFGS